MQEFDKPILCPKCGTPLNIIQVEKAVMLEWQADCEGCIDTEPDCEKCPEDGNFKDNGQGNIVFKCYHCGKTIGESNANQNWGICPKSEDY